MEPVFAKRQRGASFVRVPEVFWCRTDNHLAKGRRKARVV